MKVILMENHYMGTRTILKDGGKGNGKDKKGNALGTDVKLFRLVFKGIPDENGNVSLLRDNVPEAEAKKYIVGNEYTLDLS